MFSLAHLSDPHLALLPGAAPFLQLTGKQVLSRLAWQRKQHHIGSEAVLDSLAADLALHAPDHIAVTGDLVNLGTRQEVAAASGWLARLARPEKISLVPGNHDRLAVASDLSAWAPWMDDGNFPYLHRRGQMALLGLSTAVPTPMFLASGRLGAAQIEKAAAMLAQAGAEGLFRVMLIHHPPLLCGGGRRKALGDRAELAAILRRQGAELVLHGHHHRSLLNTLPGLEGPIPIIGVPSASARTRHTEAAGWNLYRIVRESRSWRLTTILRRYDPQTGRFVQAGEWSLALGGQ
jgi:3',5'-cyclic AMP phosphodiesterase CpdA